MLHIIVIIKVGLKGIAYNKIKTKKFIFENLSIYLYFFLMWIFENNKKARIDPSTLKVKERINPISLPYIKKTMVTKKDNGKKGKRASIIIKNEHKISPNSL